MPDPILDTTIFEHLLQLPSKAGSVLIGLFLKSAPAKLAAMESALKDGKVELVRDLAHTLIPSAGMLGCVEMQRLAESIQRAAIEGRAEELGPLMARLMASYQRTRPLLETHAPPAAHSP